jgi:hypothetical protein
MRMNIFLENKLTEQSDKGAGICLAGFDQIGKCGLVTISNGNVFILNDDAVPFNE